jgi:hypothetical protein
MGATVDKKKQFSVTDSLSFHNSKIHRLATNIIWQHILESTWIFYIILKNSADKRGTVRVVFRWVTT